MDTSSVQTLITDTASDFGIAALAIITAVIGIGVAYLLFRLGKKHIQNLLSDYRYDEYENQESDDFEFFTSKNYYKNMKAAGYTDDYIALEKGKFLNKRDGFSF